MISSGCRVASEKSWRWNMTVYYKNVISAQLLYD